MIPAPSTKRYNLRQSKNVTKTTENLSTDSESDDFQPFPTTSKGVPRTKNQKKGLINLDTDDDENCESFKNEGN